MPPAGREKVVEGLPTKSAKIRALHRAGHSRAEIARFLNIRYQHVRNVLERDVALEAEKAEVERRSMGRGTSKELFPIKVRLGLDGRVVIPAPLRAALK